MNPASPAPAPLAPRRPLPVNYARPTFTPAEAAEVFHNRPAPLTRAHPAAARPRSLHWPRAWARLRGERVIIEISRGTLARERAVIALGPRWEVVQAEHGGPFYGALDHPEFARACRAA